MENIYFTCVTNQDTISSPLNDIICGFDITPFAWFFWIHLALLIVLILKK
jgi:hypothetical protein